MSIETPELAGEDANDHQASVGDNAAVYAWRIRAIVLLNPFAVTELIS